MRAAKQDDALRRAALFREQGGLCFYCQEQMKEPPFSRPRSLREVTLEHLIPFCEGGRRGFPNEAAACNGCNNRRGTTSWLLFYCLAEIEGRRRPREPAHPFPQPCEA